MSFLKEMPLWDFLSWFVNVSSVKGLDVFLEMTKCKNTSLHTHIIVSYLIILNAVGEKGVEIFMICVYVCFFVTELIRRGVLHFMQMIFHYSKEEKSYLLCGER